MAVANLFVNARFRQRPTTGVERTATEVLSRLTQPVVELAPPGWAVSGTAGHLWEQTVLPRRADGVLWSPCNTGPVRARRHVVTIHDTAPLRHPEWFGRGFATAYRLLVPRLCRRADAVVTVSTSVADELRGLGATPGRLHVIGNGVAEVFRPAPAESIARARGRHGLAERPYVVALGSPEPRKNLARLIEAWGTELGDADLVLIGSASERVFRSVDVPIHRSVRQLGRVEDDDLAAILSGAQALASVSLYEGFGLPPIEALACGTPVVVSDIPAHREVLGPFDPLYVDPYDVAAIRRGLSAALSERRRVDAGGVAETFSWADAAGAYESLFGDLASRG